MSHPMHGQSGFPHQPPQAPKSGGSSVVKILLIVFAVLAACCVCCGLIGYFGFQQASTVLEQEAASRASANQQVQDHLGTLEPADVEWNILRSASITEELGKDCLVFDVRGPLGDGELVFEKRGSTFDRLIQIRVDGQVIPINE